MKTSYQFISFLLLYISSLSVVSQRVDFKALEKEVLEAKNNREKATAFIALASSFPPPQSGLTTSYADSVLLLSENGDELYFQNGSDYLKALGLYRKGKLEEAKLLFRKTASHFPVEDELSFKSKNFLGIIYMRTGLADSSLLIYNSLLELTKEENARARLSIHGNLGRAHRQLGNYSQAIENFEKCVNLDSTNDFSILNSYMNIASIFGNMSMPDKGVNVLKKVDVSEIPPQPIVAAYFNNIGQLYYESGELDSSLLYLRKGYELASSIKQFQLTLKNRILIAKIYLESSRLEKADNTLNSVRLDLKYYPVPPILIDFNLTKVKFFLESDLYDSALYYSQEVLKITRPKNLKHEKKNVYELMAQTHEEMGNVEASKDYYKLYVSFQDSLENSESEKFKKDAAARYMLAEKESQISKGKLESSRLKQWQIVLLIGIIGLIILAIVLSKLLNKSKSSHKYQVNENVELAKEIERNKHEIIELKSRAVLQINDIISIKADGHYLEFNLTNKNTPEIDRNRIKTIMDNLPDKFIQIHRSHIVNVDFVKIKYADKVVLDDGSELPISRTYKDSLSEKLKSN